PHRLHPAQLAPRHTRTHAHRLRPLRNQSSSRARPRGRHHLHNLHDVFYHGASGIAGELGHVTHGSDLTLRELLELASDGDLAAKPVVNDAGRAVGRAVADLCNYLNPAAVIVGGDLSLAGDALLGGVREEIDRYALPGAAQAVEVKAGVLGDRAQMLGARAVVIADTSRLRSAGLTPLNV
ncbi:MAG: ROK family protein, partial [Gaiellaceae bacterium]